LLGKVFGRDKSVRSIKKSSLQLFLSLIMTVRGSESRNIEKYKNASKFWPFGVITTLGLIQLLIEKSTRGISILK